MAIHSKQKIKSVIQQFKYEYYGRVNLPYGLHSRGADRSATINMVFPPSLEGRSVLDVGAYYGYTCFEAEARGAARVQGIELDPHRFRRAMLYKEAKDSEVEFLNMSAVEYQFVEPFDYLLFLNLLHHIRQPFSLLERALPIVQERLVIEYPKKPIKRKRRVEMPIKRILEYCGKFFKETKTMASPCKSGGRPRILAIFSQKNRV